MVQDISPKNCISGWSSSILLQVSTEISLKSYIFLLSIELKKPCKWKTIPRLSPSPFSTKNMCINNLLIIIVFCFICYLHSSSQVKCNLVLSEDTFPDPNEPSFSLDTNPHIRILWSSSLKQFKRSWPPAKCYLQIMPWHLELNQENPPPNYRIFIDIFRIENNSDLSSLFSSPFV